MGRDDGNNQDNRRRDSRNRGHAFFDEERREWRYRRDQSVERRDGRRDDWQSEGWRRKNNYDHDGRYNKDRYFDRGGNEMHRGNAASQDDEKQGKRKHDAKNDEQCDSYQASKSKDSNAAKEDRAPEKEDDAEDVVLV